MSHQAVKPQFGFRQNVVDLRSLLLLTKTQGMASSMYLLVRETMYYRHGSRPCAQAHGVHGFWIVRRHCLLNMLS